MTNPFEAFFTVCRQASDAALGHSRVTSVQCEADREGHLMDEYRRAEKAYLALLEQVRSATAFTDVDASCGDLMAVISDHSPLNGWEDRLTEWQADAGLFYNGMESRL